MVVHFAYPHPVDGHAFLPASRPGHLSLKHEVATEKKHTSILILILAGYRATISWLGE